MTINETEQKITEFWKTSRIFEKSVEKPAGKEPKGNYIFYDGPPFITGLPHYATLLPSIVKDAVPRYWTMKGYRVERVWGWDCHGLPAENQVEKELKLKNKRDIEKLGVDKFVSSCKLYVNNVSDQWKWYIDKIARWVDMDHAYKTMDISYMESVIWAFKELYNKGLIYQGYRNSLHCPRCATPLSKFEITMDAGSYRDITEQSVVVKFKLKNTLHFIKNSEKTKNLKNIYLLAWTTTPWTLPGNLAIAVNKDLTYSLVECENEKYILAKDTLKEIIKDKKFRILDEFKGKKLLGLDYEPLFDLNNEKINQSNRTYKIYHGDFVQTEDGTGIVHIAPNFGEEDFGLGKKQGLPIVDLMDEMGIYTSEAGSWKGYYFQDANKEVIKQLEKNNKLFSEFNITHSYPFCYRCSTPLIYRTQKAWYLDIDKIRNQMLETNKKINWVPKYFGEGRFKYNIENAPHWCLSRSRYWGSPIPVWKCDKCNRVKVVGSIKEIEKLSGRKVNDLHKPDIDEIEFKCSCGGTMKRVPEVLDCWFESGSMPYAQWHYPFERKDDFKKIFPADFIIEYTGQLRGWFYYLHVLSNSLFNSECFKNVIVTGVLAGTDGRKMSKSYGNYPDPKETLEKYGGDTIRMYFLKSPIILGGDMNLNEKDIIDTYKKNVMLFYNIYNFYTTIKNQNKKTSNNSLIESDKWINSRLEQLIKTITENMEKYDIPSATKPITQFIEDLSWYIRINRERMNANDSGALINLKKILERTSIAIAPFMPYVSEYVWQKITGNDFKDQDKSVHLQEWPIANEKIIDSKLEEKISKIREIISLGLKERDALKIGIKWPLKKAIISGVENSLIKELNSENKGLIKHELNVKEIELNAYGEFGVVLDKTITPELEAEGYARELSRKIQAFRKKLGLNKTDSVSVLVIAEPDLIKTLEEEKDFIKQRTNSKELIFKENTKESLTIKERFKNEISFNIKDKKGVIGIDY